MQTARLLGCAAALVAVACGATATDDDAATAGENAFSITRPLPPDGPLPACLLPPSLPDRRSPSPPAVACKSMDWSLERDGHYLLSQFGTTSDRTTMGRSTSCSALQTHYRIQCCQYDRHAGVCVDGGSRLYDTCAFEDARVPKIPFIHRTVDYRYEEVVGRVARYYFRPDGSPKPISETSAFDHPEYFYVAGAQRFGCGALLRVTNAENGRCVVVYTEDGGPGRFYESADLGARRIVDASPAVYAFLRPSGLAWKKSPLMRVEWANSGDVPGRPCEPCSAELAKQGTESRRSPFDLNHMDSGNCRATQP